MYLLLLTFQSNVHTHFWTHSSKDFLSDQLCCNEIIIQCFITFFYLYLPQMTETVFEKLDIKFIYMWLIT
jgi:hypothetical protein